MKCSVVPKSIITAASWAFKYLRKFPSLSKIHDALVRISAQVGVSSGSTPEGGSKCPLRPIIGCIIGWPLYSAKTKPVTGDQADIRRQLGLGGKAAQSLQWRNAVFPGQKLQLSSALGLVGLGVECMISRSFHSETEPRF